MSLLVFPDRSPDRTPLAGVRLADVISALTFALDLTEGQRPGHTLRTTLLAMRLGQELGLDRTTLGALYYAALLKDSGCSSNAARMAALFGSDDQTLKRDMRLVDWHDRWKMAMRTARSCGVGLDPLSRVRHFLRVARTPALTREIIAVRCERGAQIAQVLEFPAASSEAIMHVDEQWCGLGHPAGLAGDEIPLLSRILLLSQTVEAFWSEHGLRGALDMARRRRATWFDPTLVDRLVAWRHDRGWWSALANDRTLDARVLALEPGETPLLATDERLDRIARAFAAVIDAKTPFTARHSSNVARYAVAIMTTLGGDAQSARDVLRAGLLHDVGKLGVSNRILDKPGKLTDAEFGEIRKHPRWTRDILERVNVFKAFADDAAQHHERLDGRGYPWGVPAARLALPARVLAVADVYEALTADRPYRDGLPVATVKDIMTRDTGTAFDPVVLDAAMYLAEQGTFATLASVVDDGFERLQAVVPASEARVLVA
ncbi:MAG: HD domain-containing protein [Gemmatimonadetes bacterium]|nr:HD domain-containing protein [Gemmatimonadota bacterium]